MGARAIHFLLEIFIYFNYLSFILPIYHSVRLKSQGINSYLSQFCFIILFQLDSIRCALVSNSIQD